MSDLISREEALACFEALKNYSGLTIREQLRKLMSTEQTEWISVKEHGNPKEDDLYMVTVRGGFEETENEYVTTSHYIFDRGGWSVEDVDSEVTAWMPKPSPYKGE